MDSTGIERDMKPLADTSTRTHSPARSRSGTVPEERADERTAEDAVDRDGGIGRPTTSICGNRRYFRMADLGAKPVLPRSREKRLGALCRSYCTSVNEDR
ncbi:unnamed protein product [Heligmosomoides polygyrus]|uniref:Uncharacterized protein n=1 Tax=Heligmosomoides polygyrus TaxID=6339 RepID=A0A183G9F7_HELPZ|nr:unnamed protein product [Heligmosomoides polygyrus]